MPARRRLTPTSYALLGHLGLRPWSAYELTASLRRSLRWFWPIAESRIYEQARTLVELGLARGRPSMENGRRRTTYTVTAAGRRALRDWLRTPTDPWALYFEGLLRVHLARCGSREDLLRALAETRDQAEELLEVGVEVATAFDAGTHPVQEEAHIRALVFDHLWSFATTTRDRADRCLDEVETWDDLDPAGKTDRGLRLMQEALVARQPLSR